MTRREAWRAAACGLSVATLVFSPTLNTLASGNAYWLHWRTQDSFETLLAWLVVGVVAAASLAPWSTRTSTARQCLRTVAAIFWLSVGTFFAAGALVRVSVIHSLAVVNRDWAPPLAVLAVAALLAVTWRVVQRIRTGKSNPFERLLALLWPLSLVFLANLASAQWHRQPDEPAVARIADGDVSVPRPLHVVLLFDELSIDVLSDLSAADRVALPAFDHLLASSTFYTGVYLPGGQTRVAVPALFGSPAHVPLEAAAVAMVTDSEVARRGGLVHLARQAGLDVRVFGWFVDYCAGIAASANECRAVSLYNPRTLDPRFSLWHPLATAVNLLPYDWPFGLLKVSNATALHRKTLEAAGAWLAIQLASSRADIVFVHVCVPHVPFLDPALPDDRSRFVVTQAAYRRQLLVADRFLAAAERMIQEKVSADRPVTLIVISDHNSRALTPQVHHRRIVFMRRTGDVAAPRRLSRVAHGADLLWRSIDGELDGE